MPKKARFSTYEEWNRECERMQDILDARRYAEARKALFTAPSIDTYEEWNRAWLESRSKVPDSRITGDGSSPITRLQRTIDDLTELLYKMKEESHEI
jgi:hypothetical protein